MEGQLSTFQKLINTVIEFFVNYSFQVIGAIIVLVAGILIANWVANLLLGVMERKKVDITLSKFLASVVKIVIFAFALIIAAGKFGITITPFIAALGGLTFGASFALQGPLSNYGAGISIILGRPFVVGNTVTLAGVSGVVKEVKLASTVLTDEDGTEITIPNKDIVGQIIQNSRENKAVEGMAGISYESDPSEAIRIITKSLEKFKDVVQSPAPQIGVRSFGDSSIDIEYRYWVPTIKYFQTMHAVNMEVYNALQAAKIEMPFPQREVRIITQSSSIPAISGGK